MNYLTTILAFALFTFTQGIYAASPVGIWKTIDDITKEPKSLVEIKEGPGRLLSGRVIKLFKNPNRLCDACEGKERNQPVISMEVMSQLKQSTDNQDEWLGSGI